MSFRKFLNEMDDSKGTYIAVRFSKKTEENLTKYVKSLGLTPIKEFHSTIVYSEDFLGVPHGINKITGSLKPKSLGYLGEKGTKYRAIVLEVTSEILQDRFDYYCEEYGYESRFPSYLQHISLMYTAPEGLNLDTFDLPDFEIEIDHEYVEGINLP